MTEAQLYEKLGRQQAEIDTRKQAYAELLQRLAWVVSGELGRSRVLVNLTDQTWSISEPDTRPAMPATINGLPVVVVAPDEPKISVVYENEPEATKPEPPPVEDAA